LQKHIKGCGDELKLQGVIDKLVHWVDEWLAKLNSSKCKAVSLWYQRSENIECTMKGSRLENINSFIDLGVTFDKHFIFDKHISEKLIKHNC